MKPLRQPPEKNKALYRRIWREVDGCLRDVYIHHPEYFPKGIQRTAIRNSIAKRVAGAMVSFVERRGAEPKGG